MAQMEKNLYLKRLDKCAIFMPTIHTHIFASFYFDECFSQLFYWLIFHREKYMNFCTLQPANPWENHFQDRPTMRAPSNPSSNFRCRPDWRWGLRGWQFESWWFQSFLCSSLLGEDSHFDKKFSKQLDNSCTPRKINSWNLKSWWFGSDDFPNFQGAVYILRWTCRSSSGV